MVKWTRDDTENFLAYAAMQLAVIHEYRSTIFRQLDSKALRRVQWVDFKSTFLEKY